MRRGAAFAALLVCLAGSLQAAAPMESPRPDQRPDAVEAALRDAEISGGRALPQEGSLVLLSPRPGLRPENLKRKATVRQAGFVPAPIPQGRLTQKGQLCGIKGLSGEAIPPIPARIEGCGLEGGVKVRAVDGVTLSTPATIDCTTAAALSEWVRDAVIPAVGRKGGGLAGLSVAAHYSCRSRNNKPGARVSEHGRGRAIDISGLVLENGAQMNVLTGWNDPAQRKVLRTIHKKACGPFGTVLGPGSDGYHKDHIHLDTARYRNGTYCR